ncbi:MAG: hypothetical protein EP347_11270 [Alphaproteobacteria bacterium]|nr:MAG: hypothetical protein EP347_11270 [Alphaproteobacteria bacterium]
MSTTFTLQINAPVEVLWVLLNHEIQHPDKYAAQTALFSCKAMSPALVKRSVSRVGTRYDEEIEINQDALMIEQTWTACGMRPLKLILQLMPMEHATLLNLAANLLNDDDETLTDPELPDLMALATRMQKMAQALLSTGEKR